MIINNLHQLFERQTKKTPSSIVLLSVAQMFYAKLNMHANQLSYYLSLKTPHTEKPIRISTERDFALFIAILAVLKNEFLIVNNRDYRNRIIERG